MSLKLGKRSLFDEETEMEDQSTPTMVFHQQKRCTPGFNLDQLNQKKILDGFLKFFPNIDEKVGIPRFSAT
jgi:hypothetical protein